MRFKRFTLINTEISKNMGFDFSISSIDVILNNYKHIDSSIFGIHIDKNYIVLEFMFFTFYLKK